MADVSLRVTGDGLKRFDNLVAALSDGEIATIAKRALNHTGGKAKTQVIRALTKQTGLKRKTIVRAVKVRPATAGRLEYTMASSGGDIALKYFDARETRAGVSAAPFGRREVFPHTFIRGGRFPNRKDIHRGGTVFTPDLSNPKWGRGKEERTSGVIIPAEMVKGATAAAFEKAAEALSDRLSHEMAHSARLRDLTGGGVF
ncbi:hypothetical protein [Aurantimonas sp. VKM B-3413]|uniref:hypothetical protein n=1 Tax=Aurantimonas sp. VKM B-3413 TaxID=2779401 RepID=UPI001E557E49|nr:hypothetical protein [Aurantimonas sp. VKM B-3413]MCB8835951.1 hypothetical protein [Aurantimonas sp. VKM B-3413]